MTGDDRVRAVQDSGRAKVCQDEVAIGTDQQVAGLYVQMSHTVVIEMLQYQGQVSEVGDGLGKQQF